MSSELCSTGTCKVTIERVHRGKGNSIRNFVRFFCFYLQYFRVVLLGIENKEIRIASANIIIIYAPAH
jgi:hypothetical protein